MTTKKAIRMGEADACAIIQRAQERLRLKSRGEFMEYVKAFSVHPIQCMYHSILKDDSMDMSKKELKEVADTWLSEVLQHFVKEMSKVGARIFAATKTDGGWKWKRT